jgi:hypothetical protein
MRIYLAAAYHHYPLMQEVAALLTQHGHTVMSRWIKGANAAHDGNLFAPEVLQRSQQWAQGDLEDVKAAEVLLYFSEPGTRQRGGKAVEFGVALALGKRLIVVGGFEHLFHTLRAVEHVPTVTAAIALLARAA